MLTEEAHHMFVGETGVRRIVQRCCELMKEAPDGEVRVVTIDDQRQALANAAAQLRESGLLAFDIFVPDVEQLGAHDEAVPFHVRDVEQPDGGRLVIWGQNTWDGVEQLNEASLIIDELDPEGRTLQRLYRDFPQRYTFRYEMQHLLELSGFTVEAVYGDFDGGPVTEESDDLVLVARLTGGP